MACRHSSIASDHTSQCATRGDPCRYRPLAQWYIRRLGTGRVVVHASSRSSSQPVLARTNYVLIQGDDFLAVDMRPHGLVELAFGDDLILFSTFFPRWVNLSILWSFLEPMIPRTHFGVDVRGWYNGGEIGSRPMQCENGFFMQVRFLSTPFLFSELYRSAPMHVACLHTVTTTRGQMMCSGRLCTLRGVIPWSRVASMREWMSRGVRKKCEGQPTRSTRSTGPMIRKDDRANNKQHIGSSGIKRHAGCPGFVEPKQLKHLGLGEKPRARVCRAEAT